MPNRLTAVGHLFSLLLAQNINEPANYPKYNEQHETKHKDYGNKFHPLAKYLNAFDWIIIILQ